MADRGGANAQPRRRWRRWCRSAQDERI